MSRRRESPEVGEFEWRQIGDTKYATPLRNTQEWTEPDVPYDVVITVGNEAGIVECVELTLKRKPNGPPITTEGLRKVPVPRLVQWASELRLGVIKDPEVGVSSGVGMLAALYDPATRTEGHAVLASEGVATRRRILDDDLRQLADIVVRSRATGRSYIAEAGVQMGLTHDQARQWKRKAVAAGFLAEGAES